MLTETGKVVKVSNQSVWVETLRTSACETCRAKSVCGQKMLADWQSADRQGEKNYMEISTDLVLGVGDQVEIGIPEHTFVKGAMLLYLLPMLALLFGAALAQFAGLNDLLTAFGGMAAFGVSLLFIRRYSLYWQQQDDVRPLLLRKLVH